MEKDRNQKSGQAGRQGNQRPAKQGDEQRQQTGKEDKGGQRNAQQERK